jgi:hypothetical protein
MIAVVATSLRQNTIYVKVYLIYMNLVFNGLIPLVSLAILNTVVYLRLREFSLCVEASRRNESVQSREVMLAKVSCLIVAGKKFGFEPSYLIFLFSSVHSVPQHPLDTEHI